MIRINVVKLNSDAKAIKLKHTLTILMPHHPRLFSNREQFESLVKSDAFHSFKHLSNFGVTLVCMNACSKLLKIYLATCFNNQLNDSLLKFYLVRVDIH